MFPEKYFPDKIEKPNEKKRGIPMKINYNKCPLLPQGSCHLVEEVNRTI
jgi:hypothetical protein